MTAALAELARLFRGRPSPHQAHIDELLADMRENLRRQEELLMYDHPYFRDEWRA